MSDAADAYERLSLPRRAALTAEEIRGAFQKAATGCHPDTAGPDVDASSAFAALNTAQATLTSLPKRLRHLRGLRWPDAPAGPPPPMDDAILTLFSRVGGAVNAATAHVAKKRQASTFLARAALAAAEYEVQESLEAAGADVSADAANLIAALEAFDAAAAPGPDELERLAHRAAFLEKWQAQLRAAFSSLLTVE